MLTEEQLKDIENRKWTTGKHTCDFESHSFEDGVYWNCRHCGLQFCSKHRLPEDHNRFCFKRGNIFEGLEKKSLWQKIKAWLNV